MFKADDKHLFLSSVNLLYHIFHVAPIAERLSGSSLRFPMCSENKRANSEDGPSADRRCRGSLQESGLQAVLHVATA